MAAKLARSHRSLGRSPVEGRSLLKVGDVLAGKYRVERVLGEGGMGVVVAAYHQLLDQRVAVKLLYQDVADREAQSRLLLEARSAAKLNSDHVARVIDVDTGADGLPFIIMELLDGADLCQIADARGALPRWLVVDYILQALEGLAHAHVRGIIHRDLKPSNLFLANRPDGTQIIKILDFGISKSTDEGPDRRTAQLTGGRSVLGSPPYMSPEQVRAPKTVDHRTDIWSLGICMYELLTSSMPFGGDELQETFAQILEKEPAPIRSMVNGVPAGLEQVVMKCLAKNRDDRYADVGELAKALVPFGSGTWMQSADRVCATLARGADDVASGPRIRGLEPDAVIPSSPGGRLDSMQPELTGTASTVARTFTALDQTKRAIVIAAAVWGAVGLVLIGASAAYRAKHPAVADPLASAPPLAEGVVPAGPATAVVTPPSHTAGPENELPSEHPGTVIGASPAPAMASAAASMKIAGAPPAPATKPLAPATTTRKSPPTGSTKLPTGLPRTRD